jgi:hypothetical protein
MKVPKAPWNHAEVPSWNDAADGDKGGVEPPKSKVPSAQLKHG